MEEKTIMIVDDALFMRKMIGNALKEAGFSRLLEAKDGEEAVDCYRRQGADLVFMDVTMPKKDGLQALKEILEFDPQARVVMCSAIGQEAVIMEAVTVGASDFIVKPFKKERLVKIAENLLGIASQE